MPLTQADFPAEVQVAFFMISLLSDDWEGMSGTYMGKEWGSISTLFDIHRIEDREQVFLFMKLYERALVSYRHKKSEAARKKETKKASGGDKEFTHKVQG